MDSSDVAYLSNDESPFVRNQRLRREHNHEREDSLDIQQHLSRVLDEVKEGKR